MPVQYVIDAFENGPFTGNPAAVVPLDGWADDSVLQAIAAQNNISETAFFIDRGEEIALRWFSPTQEIDLCGHATLATRTPSIRRLVTRAMNCDSRAAGES